MVKEHTKVGLCIFCLMSVSIGLKIASKVLNIKHFSGQLIIKDVHTPNHITIFKINSQTLLELKNYSD